MCGGGGGGNRPARSSRRASMPPFRQIFQLDRAVRPPSPRSTPPENTTKWVFQSKNSKIRRASQPPFWQIFQLDWAVEPPSPCSPMICTLFWMQHCTVRSKYSTFRTIIKISQYLEFLRIAYFKHNLLPTDC